MIVIIVLSFFFLPDILYPYLSYTLPNLTLSGPGGLRGPDGQTHSCQSETSYPMMPKLGDF